MAKTKDTIVKNDEVEVKAEETQEEVVAEVKTEEAAVEEVKAEETATEEVVAKGDEATEEVVEDKKEEGEVPAETKADEAVEEKAEEATAEEATDEADKTAQPSDLVKFMQEIASKLETLSTLVKQAPTEGAADEEETSKEEAKAEETPASEEVTVETPAEEVKAEETPAEDEAEKVSKSDTSSEGASTAALEDLQKSYDAKLAERDATIEDLVKRIKALEEAPAPSKVVFTKAQADAKADKLRAIEDQLEDIAKVRDTDPETYRLQRLDEKAIDLIKAKKALKEGQV